MSEGKNARDTQFIGFAKLLWGELVEDNKINYIDGINLDDDRIEQHIAQRMYDFLYFQVEQAYKGYPAHGEIRESMKFLHDMTEWPSEG